MDKNLGNRGSKGSRLRLEKLTDIHFNWYSTRSYVYILTSIALLILIIGSINYMNLNAAIYSRRLKEIRIRKILGASKNKLALTLLGESVIFCFIAFVIAVFIVPFALEYIKVSDTSLRFRFADNLSLISGFIFLSIITGFVSGIYPALIVASFKPGRADSNENTPHRKSYLRNSLVVFQFIVSTGLIISQIVCSKEYRHGVYLRKTI